MSVEERRKYENLKSRQEGKEEQKIEVALKMLSKNLTDDLILECVDITQEQLTDLKKSL